MKLQKNKTVFVLVVVCVVLFMVAYSIWTFGKDEPTALEPNQIPLPDLEGNTMEYESKLEALDALKEERKVSAPPLYPDHMVDEKGYFNPDYMEYEKQRIVDSVHQSIIIDATDVKGHIVERPPSHNSVPEEVGDGIPAFEKFLSSDKLALEHQLFFASNPKLPTDVVPLDDHELLAYVNGEQVVKEGHRLVLRLERELQIDHITFSRGTPIYGFVKIRPNRLLLDIYQVASRPVALKAYDIQDGREGIYVENHLREAIGKRALDETMGDINVPGFPPLRGIKDIFRRHNRTVKVHVPNNYQILLKP